MIVQNIQDNSLRPQIRRRRLQIAGRYNFSKSRENQKVGVNV